MDMKKWIIAVVTCSALTLGACGRQNKDLSAASPYKVYRAGMNAEFALFESQTSEGNVEGSDIDLMSAMARAGNFKVEFKHQPWESLFSPLGNGDIDIVISGITITDEHKQSMDFDGPYFEITQIILVPKGKKVTSSDDLKNMAKVSVIADQTGDFSVSRLLGNGSPKIPRFEAIPLVIKELEDGGLDSVVSDSAVIADYVKNNPIKGLDFITLPDFSIENHGIAVRKGDETTVKMLNDALKKVRGSDEYDKIYAKYSVKEETRAGKAKKTK